MHAIIPTILVAASDVWTVLSFKMSIKGIYIKLHLIDVIYRMLNKLSSFLAVPATLK